MVTRQYITKDLSSNGAFVAAADHYFRMNDIVNMEIMMPQKPIEEVAWQRSMLLARGRVVRSDSQGFAVAFTSRSRLVTAEGEAL